VNFLQDSRREPHVRSNGPQTQRVDLLGATKQRCDVTRHATTISTYNGVMMQTTLADPWRSQSAVTQLAQTSAAVKAIDDLPADLASLRAVSQQLVAHYAGSSDGTSGPVEGEQLSEVDTRYAQAMFAHLLAKGPPTLSRPRPAEERIVGCCRDFAVLFVAMARHKGYPARVRVGYATYF
jgi:transglutaminase-like putative cysteine protease